MNILVTGAQGFVGRNLVENLKNIQAGKNKSRVKLCIEQIFEYDVNSKEEILKEYCEKSDFVFHLAGVNRPKENTEFKEVNLGLSRRLLDCLRRKKNTCPVMLSSSIQAGLTGRFADSEYGRSKLAGEELFFQYAAETGAKVLVYRFPNLFGKWCRPNYNSAVATFCNAVANNLPYTVNDRFTELELLYIDDLVEGMLDALEGREKHCDYHGEALVPALTGRYCYVPVTYHVTLGEIVDLLEAFKAMPETCFIPEIPPGSFAKKLYSTYLSYLSWGSMTYALKMDTDSRGTFAELVKTFSGGQVSVNIVYPGQVRGQHWHNSKWEIFVVVSGHGLIQERKIGLNPETGKEYPVHSFEVSGEQIKAVQVLPGYTHNIINMSETENLISVMWANEQFNAEHPDTFYERVSDGTKDVQHSGLWGEKGDDSQIV